MLGHGALVGMVRVVTWLHCINLAGDITSQLAVMIRDGIMGVRKDSLHKYTWHSCPYMYWDENRLLDYSGRMGDEHDRQACGRLYSQLAL